MMRHAAGLLALLACSLVHGADVVPRHLIGVWGTSESLFVGDSASGESTLHLGADGLGILAFSTRAPHRLDGKPEEGIPPRAIIGFPIRATVDGDMLTWKTLLPKGTADREAAKLAALQLACRYDVAGPTLTCKAGDGEMVLRRYAEALPEDTAKALEQVRGR